MKESGFLVPDFVCVDSQTLSQIFSQEEPRKKQKLEELAEEITGELKSDRFAVRSSALIEDTQENSMAGQFRTKLNLEPEEIAEAIIEICEQAKPLVKNNLEQFSIIVQVFIEPDIAGITFTRNPQATREMVINYINGRGELLVGGQTKGNTIQLNWSGQCADSIVGLSRAIEDFKKIEANFNFPQDIEWCIKNNQWYFLQSRPITTISQAEYEGMRFLDQKLIQENFYFAKNEITEIAPKPSEFTLDLLKMIYAHTGPVQKVYAKYKIKYEANDFFVLLGNELFVDKNQEIKTLLPSYGYDDKLEPHQVTFSGFWTSLKNSQLIGSIATETDQLFYRLKESYESGESADFEEALDSFIKNYEIVFEINLLSAVYLNKLQKMLQGLPIKLVSLLGCNPFDEPLPEFQKREMVGNSLEIADESDFVSNIKNENKDDSFDALWSKVEESKKEILRKNINQTLILERLRELGRWLIVKKISNLRSISKKLTISADIQTELIYFAKIEEIKKNEIDRKTLEDRRETYQKFNSLIFPSTISSFFTKKNKQLLGISAGQAEGTLVDINSLMNETGKKILFTKSLSPDLAQYFSQIEAIISEDGSFLSHLAILAREHNLPVIVNVNLEKMKLKIGDIIKIDANKEEMIKK